jgi:hypothetical protein
MAEAKQAIKVSMPQEVVDILKSRRPIQMIERASTLTVLCNDGTIWELWFSIEKGGSFWKQVESIPQPEGKP